MKTFGSLLLMLCLSVACSAQQRTSILLYPEYQNGVIYLNTRQQVRVPINYDAGKHCVLYRQNGYDMELVNTQSVDSIKIGNDLFCRVKNKFYQVINYSKAKLLIDWDLDRVHIGYKGAFGNVTQVRAQSVNLSLVEGHEFSENKLERDEDVFKTRNHNKYMLLINGELKVFSNKKTLLKAFPTKSEAIEKIIKEEKTDFTTANDIIKLVYKILALN